MEFVNDDDIKMGVPPLFKRQESKSDDEVDEPSIQGHVSVRHSAIEHVSGVSSVFKVVKQHLLNGQKNNNIEVNPYKK